MERFSFSPTQTTFLEINNVNSSDKKHTLISKLPITLFVMEKSDMDHKRPIVFPIRILIINAAIALP